MSAIVNVLEKNGAAEAPTVRSGGRTCFKTVDYAGLDDNGQLVVPGVGSARSYEKWLRFSVGPVGPSGQITNPKFWISGPTLGVGIFVFARTTNAGSFSTPSTPANDSAGTDAFSYTAASPKALDAVNVGPFSTANADFGDYLVLWMTIGTSAKPQKPTLVGTFNFGWDET